MPRTCTVCTHPKRAKIDEALVSNRSTNRSIAKQYGLDDVAVWRHRQSHLPETIAKAHEAKEIARADGLVAQVAAMKQEAEAILQDARRSPGSQARRDALLAIDKALKALELIGRIEGELRDGTQVHLTLVESPEWLSLQAKLLAVLDRHPAARADVLAALRGDVAIPPVSASR